MGSCAEYMQKMADKYGFAESEKKKNQPSASKTELYINQIIDQRKEETEKAKTASLDIIEKYRNKITNGDYLTEDDLRAFKGGIDDYIKITEQLQKQSNSQADENYLQQWETEKNNLLQGYDQLRDIYNSCDNEEQFKISQMSIEELKAKVDTDWNEMLDDDINIIRKLTSSAAYDRETAIYNAGMSQEAYDQIEADRNYISEKYGVDLSNARTRGSVLNKLMNEVAGKTSGVAYTTQSGQNVTWQELYDDAVAYKDIQDRYSRYSGEAGWNESADSIGLLQNDFYLLQSLAETGAYDRDDAIYNAGMSEETYNQIEADRKYISEKYGIDLSNAKTRSKVLQQLIASDLFENTMQYKYVDKMTDEEKAVLSYIYERQGHEAALAWHKSREKVYQERHQQDKMRSYVKFGEDHPVLATLFSVAANVYSAPEQLYNMANYLRTGEMKQNTNAMAASGMRSGVSNEVDWTIGNWDAFDFIYNTTMSGVDSATSMLLGPLSGVSLGLSAAASASNEALNRGMDSRQAFWTGLASGTFEGLFESFSIGNFKAMKEVPADTWKGIAKNIGKSMLVNASEETATEIANILYDTFANGDFSQWDTAVRQYEAQGMSHDDAMRKVWGDHVLQVVEAGASGALMGIGFGAIANAPSVKYAKQNARNTQAAKQFAKEIAKEVKAEGNTERNILPGKVNFESNVVQDAVSDEVVSQVQRIADATGRTINFYSGDAGENGKYNKRTGEIFVNVNGADPVVQVVSHEMTHSIEKAGAYGELSQLVLKRIKAEGGNLAAMQKAKQATYAKNGVDLKTPAEIDAEIVAEYVSKHLLTNEQSILSLTQESPSLGRRILNWLDSVIAKLGNKVAQERTFLLNARNLYAKALFQTQGSFNAEATTTAPMNTAGSAAANGVMETKETHHSEQSGAAEISGAEELRQTIREQYANGDLSETEFDEMMELIDQQEEESAGNEEQYSLNETLSDVTDGIVDLSNHNELSKRLDGLTGSQKYKVIQNYILEVLGDQPITMKDGRSVIVDRSDALHIAHNAANKKTAQISEIRSIVENADLYAEETDVDHKKFDYFCYYKNVVRHDGKIYPVYLNVGRAINDKTFHLYDITNRIRATADRINGLERPKTNEGYALTSDDSTISIRNRQKNVNEKFSISDQVSKQDVVNDLRQILQRGGDPAELRRYVENMERGTESAAEIDSTENQDAEVQEILHAAREQNISVDEYLRRNWEQYEYDGQLNATARTALDLEKGNVQYSISNSNKKYDYTKSFTEQVDDYKAGLIPAGDTLLIGATPEVYQSIGFNALPMTINTTHIDYALNGTKDADHFMGETALKQLPESIKDPIAVFVSQTHDTTSVVALLNFTVNGKQTVAPIVIDGFGKNNNVVIDSNAVTSAYGKTTAVNQLFQAIKDDAAGKFSLLYVNKKEAVSLLQRAGHQLSGTMMPRDGFIHSIRESGSPVKTKFQSVTETQQFKRWFGDWQKHPQKASKIVNQDGSPMVMYHGSPAQFAIFDKKKARSSGQYGSGFYFTNSQSHAGTYGQEYRVYLNIRNPLESGRTEVSRRQAETFMNAVAENEDYSIENYGTYDIDTIVETIMGNSDSIDTFKLIQDVNLTAIGDMVEAAELFNQVNNTQFDGIVTATETVAFYPEQIKSATDNIGTFDGSNPDIRYSISEDQSAEESVTTGEELPEDPRSGLPRKAQEFLKRAENKLLRDIGNKLGVPSLAQRERLRPIIQEISNEYLRTGTVSDEKLTELFEKAYAEGVVVDAEFYEQYKDLKKHLRTNPVTISEQDKADIADYADFKQKARYTLRIVDKGGLPVDVAYDELRGMAQELFPESITHPADQLVRMYEVARSIQITEKSLQDYYGENEPEYRRWAKNDFAVSVGEVMGDLRVAKRYGDERLAAEETVPVTVEEAMEAYTQLKAARRTVDKAVAKNLLTDYDNALVGDLLKGQITLENLDPDSCNVKGITAVYEAKQEYERIYRLITKYKQQVKSDLLKNADRYLETANDWKDKKTGIAYSRETMERNILDIVPERTLAKSINREYFEPVRTAEAAATKMKTEFRNRVRELNLSTKVEKGNLVSEAHAVQLLGEARDNIRVLEKSRGIMKMRDGKTLQEWNAVVDNLWAENPNLDVAKIEQAIEEFRKIYDELFRMMNDVRVRFGYEPVNYRQGYFPHFQPGDGDGILSQFGKVMGIDTNVAALPTTINGLTHMFRPGIQWFGNAHERLGFNTAYDAVEGFDKYIEGVASVIHQTENIQKLRALASQIRYRTSDEGIRKQVDAVYENTRLSEEEKQIQINYIYEHGKYTLSNFVNELDEYVNLLANKKSRLDRTVESAIGRKYYTIMKAWEARVGANMIAGNLSSALTNIIPLTQANAQLDRGILLRGMWAALQSYRADDGIVAKSDFLTNRRGSDPLVKTWAQKASEKLGTPMELIDTFVSDSIVRAAYLQNIKLGLSESEAMHQADIFAARVMAERSKGATPTLFQSSNPLIKAFTQFQLEVNNQFSEVFKDIPRNYADRSVAVLTMVLLKYFIGAWLFDEAYEYFIGRRPALDPIDILNDMIGDLTGYELPNVLELGIGMISGDMPSFETERVGVGKAGTNLAKTALAELPFSSGLNLIGIETDGGRIPVSSSIPDLTAIWDAATTEGWSGEKRWKEIQDELNKLAYVLPPFGGGQASKSWKGIKAFIEGGSYTVDAEGNKVLQYPVYNDNPSDFFWNMVRTAIMGKNSLPEAQEWVDSGFDGLNAKQTAVYQDLLDAGVNDREAFAILKQMKDAEKTADKTKKEIQRDILIDSDLPQEGKAIAFYGLLASDSDREVMDKLADMEADTDEVAKVLMQISNANKLTGSEASITKRNAIADSALTDEEKSAIYHEKISDSRDDDIKAFSVAGLDFNNFVAAQNAYAKINEEYDTASDKAVAYARWVNDQNYTEKQATVVKSSFAFYSQVPASAKQYDGLVSAGLSDNDAYNVVNALSKLEPAEGKKQVSDAQKWRAVIENTGAGQTQMTALSVVMSESHYNKVVIAGEYNLSPDVYTQLYELLPSYDANGNGSYSQAEVEAAIDGMCGSISDQITSAVTGDKKARNLTNVQKSVLWQLVTGSSSAKNNPYNVSVGNEVIAKRSK